MLEYIFKSFLLFVIDCVLACLLVFFLIFNESRAWVVVVLWVGCKPFIFPRLFYYMKMVNDDLDLGRMVREIAIGTEYLRGNLDNLREKIKDLYGTMILELRDVHYKLDHLIEMEREPVYYRSGLQDFFSESNDCYYDLHED